MQIPNLILHNNGAYHHGRSLLIQSLGYSDDSTKAGRDALNVVLRGVSKAEKKTLGELMPESLGFTSNDKKQVFISMKGDV